MPRPKMRLFIHREEKTDLILQFRNNTMGEVARKLLLMVCDGEISKSAGRAIFFNACSFKGKQLKVETDEYTLETITCPPPFPPVSSTKPQTLGTDKPKKRQPKKGNGLNGSQKEWIVTMKTSKSKPAKTSKKSTTANRS